MYTNKICIKQLQSLQNSLDSESPEDEASNSGSVPSGSGHSNGNGNGSDQPDIGYPEIILLQPPAPRPPPCLVHSLQALTTPRPPDNVAPELIAQLPTEGEYVT